MAPVRRELVGKLTAHMDEWTSLANIVVLV
jgi:hypothetical protein